MKFDVYLTLHAGNNTTIRTLQKPNSSYFNKYANPKLKEWVKALRSGKYLQATGRLVRKDDGQELRYCCLGVLSSLFDRNQVQHSPDVRSDFKEYAFATEVYGETRFTSSHMFERDGQSVQITPSGSFISCPSAREANYVKCYCQRIDIHIKVGDYCGSPSSLAELNDSGAFDFNDIADFIEHYFYLLANYEHTSWDFHRHPTGECDELCSLAFLYRFPTHTFLPG